jgi:hypothetical protein
MVLAAALLVVVGVAAQASLVDIVCKSVQLRGPEGKTVTMLHHNGDVDVGGKLVVDKDLNVTGKIASQNTTEIERSLKGLSDRIHKLEQFVDSTKKDGRIEWKVFHGKMDRDGDLAPVDFGRKVLEAEVCLVGFYVSYSRGGRLDHNVDTIRVQLKPRIDGTRVITHAWNYMHDDQAFNGDHCSSGGEISILVIARVEMN